MNPFPLWRGITRHICNEAAEAFSAFVDSLPYFKPDWMVPVCLFALVAALPRIIGA